MAWESRRGRGRYYTRSRRVDGRVAREYVGMGRVGEVAARLDAEDRGRRAVEADAVRAIRRSLAAPLAASLALDRACRLAFEASLMVAGFRRHRGTWRLRHAQ